MQHPSSAGCIGSIRIGQEIKVAIDAPDAVVVKGEVRHNVAWNFHHPEGARGRPGMSAIGVRFVAETPVEGVLVPGSTAGN